VPPQLRVFMSAPRGRGIKSATALSRSGRLVVLRPVLSLYRKVAVLAAQRAVRAWPVALSLFVYAAILLVAAILTSPLGMLAGFVMAFVLAACWSSYLELISQAVAGSKIRVRWDDFKRTFGVRLWDVVSVMFAFWIISLLTSPLTNSPDGPKLTAILGIAMAFFFNVVPELLYQGNTRSFSLLLESARFMLAHPVVWLLPNLVFAGVALGASGQLNVQHPAELLVLFGSFFSSPMMAAGLLMGMPRWALPLLLIGLHYAMVFRGILFSELQGGGGNARLRAFQAQMRR
jgi:hypothetical protein